MIITGPPLEEATTGSLNPAGSQDASNPSGVTPGGQSPNQAGICPSGFAYNDGDHVGADYFVQDWNWGGGNDDDGKTLLSASEGEVIFRRDCQRVSGAWQCQDQGANAQWANRCRTNACHGSQVIVLMQSGLAIRYPLSRTSR